MDPMEFLAEAAEAANKDVYAGTASGGPLHEEHIEATTGRYVYVTSKFQKGFYVFHRQYRTWIWEGYV